MKKINNNSLYLNKLYSAAKPLISWGLCEENLKIQQMAAVPDEIYLLLINLNCKDRKILQLNVYVV